MKTTLRSTTLRRIAATTLVTGALAGAGAGIANAAVERSALVPDVSGDTVVAAEQAFEAAGFTDITVSNTAVDPATATVTGSNNLPDTYQFLDDVIVLQVAS
ncbi:hypothetical protein ACNHUS_35905 [Actinomycetes bacterium M1A6_2h]